MKNALLSFVTFALLLTFSSVPAFEPDTSDELQLSVAKAILDIKNSDPGIDDFFENSAGYAVFTNVGGDLMYQASVGGQKFKYEDV